MKTKLNVPFRVWQYLLLFSLLPLFALRSLAGCDGFGGTGGSCGTGGDIIYFTVANGQVTITGISGYNDQEVIIPTNGLPVVSIGPYAFAYSGVTNVVIPETVTTIGEGAFYNCDKLAGATIPKSVTSLGNAAFADCGNLPAGLDSIDHQLACP